MNDDIVILNACRTPFGRFGGSLKDFDLYDLSARIMKEVVDRAQVDPTRVDHVFWGMGDTSQCKDVYTPVAARQALLKAGLPDTVTSLTLDKACVSGASACQLGMWALRLGEAQATLCGGVTCFSRQPFIYRGSRWVGHRFGDMRVEDPLFELGYKDFKPVAVDAGEVALENGVTREDQDLWAYGSHRKYGAAHGRGLFEDEMIPLVVQEPKKEPLRLHIDEQYRPDVQVEKLARLPTVYGSPTITAGNAPGLNDGAAAVLLTTRKRAEEWGIRPIAQLVEIVNTAMEPRYIAAVPAYAIEKLLVRTGTRLSDVRRIEINEAFAAMPLVSTKILSEKGHGKLEDLRERTNVNGGAVAIGHPNTASGARLIMTLAYELKRMGGGLGIAAICGGLAQGDAALVRVE